MTIATSLTAFIQAELVGEERALKVDASTRLIDSGLIDSMGLMQIIAFIEEQTGVRIPDEEVMPENFQTVDSMVRLIARLEARRAGTGP
ncbi:MAG TPA: acyl carrier protein [Gemmatimonadaceae bacterium]|jgi:acyl carrier protein|nr:acyl carrier protein [Gemmatimonadaceae bacterium]